MMLTEKLDLAHVHVDIAASHSQSFMSLIPTIADLAFGKKFFHNTSSKYSLRLQLPSFIFMIIQYITQKFAQFD